MSRQPMLKALFNNETYILLDHFFHWHSESVSDFVGRVYSRIFVRVSHLVEIKEGKYGEIKWQHTRSLCPAGANGRGCDC